MAGEKLTRFKKAAYRGGNSNNDVPRWHIAVRQGMTSSSVTDWKWIDALCGYRVDWPGLRTPVNVSNAKKPSPKAPQCRLCVAAYEKSKTEAEGAVA